MDRQTRANYFDGAVVQSTYTPEGLQDTVTDSRGTTHYGYDVHDRLIRTNYPDGQFVAYSYDKASNLLSMATPAGTTNYTYNKVNQMLTATNSTVGSTSFTYDPVGLPKTMTLPNGVLTTYGYDPLDRLTNVTQQRSGTTLGAYAYTLDNVGNRTRVVEQGGSSIRWTYDDAYRLLSETRYDPTNNPITSSSFTYDPNGNRLTEIVDGVTTTYTYNDLDQMTSDGTNTYAYDDRGNLIGSSDGTQYQYDAQDRMVGVTLPDTTVITYEYDAEGRRVAQTVNGQKTKYVWDQRSTYGDVVLETDAANTPQVAYTMANDRILAQTRGGVNSYYLSDGQGSTRTLTNSAGSITDTYSYTAFGEIYSQTGATANNYLYTGQYFDALTGLYNLRARYYDPNLGRFLSRDTYAYNYHNPIELNRYTYVANNPINGYDPSGHFTLDYSFAGIQSRTVTGMYGGAIGGATLMAIKASTIAMLSFIGACGQEYKDRVRSWNASDLAAYMAENILQGAFYGMVIGGGAGAAGVPGLAAAAYDGYSLVKDTVALAKKAQQGHATICDIAPLLIDALFLYKDSKQAWKDWGNNPTDSNRNSHQDNDGNSKQNSQDGYQNREGDKPYQQGEGEDPGSSRSGEEQNPDGTTDDPHEETDSQGNHDGEEDTTTVRAGCMNSFSAETSVATEDGFVAISEIREGDEVLAYNEETGETDSYTVTDTISHIDEIVVHLTIDDELLETTPEHPFYTVEGEWVYAKDLEVGDQIRNLEGEFGTLERVEFIQTTQQMYNLTVDEAHTFFVGDGQWLVHNTDDCWLGPKPAGLQDPDLKDLVDEDFRFQSTTRNGGTADAVNNEVATGNPTGGRWHVEKSHNLAVAYQRWINSHPDANVRDIETAQQLIATHAAAVQNYDYNVQQMPSGAPTAQNSQFWVNNLKKHSIIK